MATAASERRADFVQVLEALYAPEPDGEAWARGVVAATSATVRDPASTGINVVAHGDDHADPVGLLNVNSDPKLSRVMAELTQMLPQMSPELQRLFFFPGRPFVTHHELEPRLPAHLAAHLRAQREFTGVRDVAGLFAYPEPGLAAVLYWGTQVPRYTPSPAERRVLHHVASHFDAAFRLRTRPELVVAAVLAPDGSLLDLEHTALEPRRSVLASRVALIERARLRKRRREPDATNAWRALLDGRYTVVPREDRDGMRYYLLVVNPPGARESTVFTEREVDVVRLAARGFSGKQSAYALGLSQAVISEALARAATKLGLRSRVELVRIAAALFGPRESPPADVTLTDAERHVLGLLRRGLSNAEIARLRGRSTRTVANQVAALLAKTGSPTRRALAARAAEE